jgi:hypothetical protein
MYRFLVALMMASTLCQPCMAAPCGTKADEILQRTLGTAITISKKAFEVIPPSSAKVDARYSKYFGAYSDTRRDIVKKVVSQVIASLTVGNLKFECETNSSAQCAIPDTTLAWVIPVETFTIHICLRFFDTDEEERPALFVHEMSHFIPTATQDGLCSNIDNCAELAKSNPDGAVTSGASYQAFVFEFI